MDNRIFNVNGRTIEQLELAIKLLLLDEYGKQISVVGWYFKPEKGIVLTWYCNEDSTAKPFTDNMGRPQAIEPGDLVETLWNWLFSAQAKTVILKDWDRDLEDDVSTAPGWRLYTEDWGHVKKDDYTIDSYSIAAFTPAFMWYGK